MIPSQAKKFVTHREIFELLKKHGKTKAWLNTLSSRYGLIPKPIIQSQTSMPAEKWRLGPGKHQRCLFDKQGRVFLYHEDVKRLIEEIINEHDRNNVPYLQVVERFRGWISEINKSMGYPENEGAAKSAHRFGSRLKDLGFYENFEAAMSVRRRSGFLRHRIMSLSGLSMMAEDAKRLGVEYHRMLSEKNSQTDNEKRECERIGKMLDYMHSLMETTIKFFVKETQRRGEGADAWMKAVLDGRQSVLDRKRGRGSVSKPTSIDAPE